MTHAKLTPSHLERKAFVYVRQSSPTQVQFNRESQELQYGLVHRAQQLGWPEASIVVIDEDLGLSGTSSHHRKGFQFLVSEVSLGHVGIVIGTDASRLARNNRDWYNLLDFCALLDTLIADCEGVYHPGEYNDRLLLGLKGTISEAELHCMQARMKAGLENKARKGELVLGLPVGLQLASEGSIVKHPDELVQHAITLVFEKFKELRNVGHVLAWFRDHDLTLPRLRHRQLKSPSTIVWRTPTHSVLYLVLTNPVYAGAYGYGRTRRTVSRTPDGASVFRYQKLPRDQWQVLLPKHHEGYITWEQFLQNQEILRSNRRFGDMDEKSRPGVGTALLQGLARCGRRMQTEYGRASRYTCRSTQQPTGEPACQGIGAHRLDEAVVQAFLDAVAPANVEVTLEALARFAQEREALRHQWELQIEKATYEAERAHRQYCTVEPENRLVARELERQWNEKLQGLDAVRQQAERHCSASLELTPHQVSQIYFCISLEPNGIEPDSTRNQARPGPGSCRIIPPSILTTSQCPKVQEGRNPRHADPEQPGPGSSRTILSARAPPALPPPPGSPLPAPPGTRPEVHPGGSLRSGDRVELRNRTRCALTSGAPGNPLPRIMMRNCHFCCTAKIDDLHARAECPHSPSAPTHHGPHPGRSCRG